MTPFAKAVYLLALGELGEITSAELRSELGNLKGDMTAALEAEKPQEPPPPAPQY